MGQFFFGAYPPRLFITAHVHLLLVGFMLMIVMGLGQVAATLLFVVNMWARVRMPP